MKADSEIQKEVMEELKWEAVINVIKPAEIGVAVKNGIVTLSGGVDSYLKKSAAEKAGMRVAGVRGVANDITIRPGNGFEKTDSEIAEAILNAIKWSTSIPEEKVKVKVDDGWVTLEGEVEWEFQKRNCKSAIEDLRGVRGITNSIKVVSKALAASDIKKKISDSIQRNAAMDASRIKVETSGNKVILSGEVRSLAEKWDAETAAWSAPGIAMVENKIEVNYSDILV